MVETEIEETGRMGRSRKENKDGTKSMKMDGGIAECRGKWRKLEAA
jgi:hypothetical protein